MNEIKTKKCLGACQQVLPLTAFASNATKADKLQSECRDCRKTMGQKWREANPGYWSQWYEENKAERLEYVATYTASRKEGDPEGHRSYMRAHQRMRRVHGPAKNYKCACGCGEQALDWALMADGAGVKKSLHFTWSDSADDYVPMNRICHRNYDTGNLTVERKDAA